MKEYIEQTLNDKPKLQTYSPKCTPRDIEKMIEPVETKPHHHATLNESKMKRATSAKQFNNLTRIGNQTLAANIATDRGGKENEHFKFSLITENAKKNAITPSGTSLSRVKKEVILFGFLLLIIY